MKIDFELKRKIFHLFFGTAILLLIYYKILSLLMLSGLMLIAIILSAIASRRRLPVISFLLKEFDRNEKIPGKGGLTFLTGILIVWLLFKNSPDIVLASTAVLTYGDSFSSIFSKYIGRTKHPFSKHKLLEGTIAGIIASFLSAMFFVSAAEALICSITAMAVEAISIKRKEFFLDDNITIPITAALTLAIIRLIYGFL